MTTNSQTAELITVTAERLVDLAVQVRKDSFHEAGIKLAKAAQLVAEAAQEISDFTLTYAEVAEHPKFDFYYGTDCEES